MDSGCKKLGMVLFSLVCLSCMIQKIVFVVLENIWVSLRCWWSSVFVEPTLLKRVAPLSAKRKTYTFSLTWIWACPPISIGLTNPKTRQGGDSLNNTEFLFCLLYSRISLGSILKNENIPSRSRRGGIFYRRHILNIPRIKFLTHQGDWGERPFLKVALKEEHEMQFVPGCRFWKKKSNYSAAPHLHAIRLYNIGKLRFSRLIVHIRSLRLPGALMNTYSSG